MREYDEAVTAWRADYFYVIASVEHAMQSALIVGSARGRVTNDMPTVNLRLRVSPVDDPRQPQTPYKIAMLYDCATAVRVRNCAVTSGLDRTDAPAPK